MKNRHLQSFSVASGGFRSLFLVGVVVLFCGTLLLSEFVELSSTQESRSTARELGMSTSLTQIVAQDVTVSVTENWKYRPWKCTEKRKEMRESGTDPNKISLNARLVSDVSGVTPFYMSLSTKKYDPKRWSIMERGVYYEKRLTDVFVRILNDDTIRNAGNDVRVVDVGSNQGWFSVVPAAMGYTVDAFDANPINSLRICESNHVNAWAGDGYQRSRSSNGGVVNVYNLGVSDTSGSKIPFAIQKRNPGGSSFVRGVAKRDTDNYEYIDVDVVSLDDLARERGWLSETSETVFAILKVDVEGLDEQVLLGAEQLVATGRVRNVLMEFSSKKLDVATNMERIFAAGGMKLCAHGGESGPDQETGKVSGSAAVEVIKSDCFGRRLHCNLWWCK